MVQLSDVDFGPAGEAAGSGDSRVLESAPFVITGATRFAPRLFPETIRVTKQRELDRQKGFCGGEDVLDNGAKNRDIHVTGRIRGDGEKAALDALADSDAALDLSSATWSGEVRVSEVEYEGPLGWHPPSGSMYWQYTMDLVSTGRDETEEFEQIEQDGEPVEFTTGDALRGV